MVGTNNKRTSGGNNLGSNALEPLVFKCVSTNGVSMVVWLCVSVAQMRYGLRRIDFIESHES